MHVSKSVGLSVGMLVCLAFACSETKTDTSNNNNPTPTTDGGDTKDSGNTTTPDSGPTVELPKPVLCPETDYVTPKLPNSVYIGDVVLNADTTWTADKIYLINDDFKIQGHKLTVEAGTTICLTTKGKIYVGQGIDPGEIHLNGTKDKPIVITAFPATSDPKKPDAYHGGIQFDTYQSSSLSYVNIWYGGGGGGSSSPPFEITASGHGTDPNAALLVDHLVVGAVQSRGPKIGRELGVADGSSIQFTGFDARDGSSPDLQSVLELDWGAVVSVAKAWNMTGATIPDGAKHAMLLNGLADGKLQKSTDIVDFGLPFLWKNQTKVEISGMQDDPVGPTLTIHEGVTMKMDGVVYVGGSSGNANGNLVVAGTAAKPVVFTSAADTPANGDWEGFYFITDHYDATKTKIENAQILYAGVDGSNGQQINQSVGRCGTNYVGAVMITGSGGTAYPGPTIKNTKIAHSKSWGIVADASDTGGQCSTNYADAALGNTFEDDASGNVKTGPCP